MKRIALAIAVLALAGCAGTRTVGTAPLVIPAQTAHARHDTGGKPSEPSMNDPFGAGYRKALRDFRMSIQQPFGPYARDVNPMLVARPPKIVRVYTNMIRVGRMIYPEGWYYLEVHPGTPAGVPPRRR